MLDLNSLMLDYGMSVSFTVIMAIFATRALVIAGGASAWIAVAAWPQRHKVVLPAQHRVNIARDMGRGLGILAFDALAFSILLHLGWIRAELAPSPLHFWLVFWGFAIWTEIYFYFSHRALHHPKLYWIHRFHHEGRGTNPWTSLAFSYGERAILLAGAFAPLVLLSLWTPVSLAAFTLYYLVNYILNVYHHLNVELMPRAFAESFLFRWLGTAVSHGLHHLRFRGNYGLYTVFLDRWFGTDFPDYPERFKRVLAGNGAL